MDWRDELVGEFCGQGFTRAQSGVLADLWMAQDALYGEATRADKGQWKLTGSPERTAAIAANREFISTAARFERENKERE